MCNQPTRLTQPGIPPGSLNRVPASAGGKGWNVTSAGWQVTLCDPIWHVSSSSGVACCELLYPVTQLDVNVAGRRDGPVSGGNASDFPHGLSDILSDGDVSRPKFWPEPEFAGLGLA